MCFRICVLIVVFLYGIVAFPLKEGDVYLEDNSIEQGLRKNATGTPKTLDTLIDIYRGGILTGLSLLGDAMGYLRSPVSAEAIGDFQRKRREQALAKNTTDPGADVITTTTGVPTTTTDVPTTELETQPPTSTTTPSNRQERDSSDFKNEIESLETSAETTTKSEEAMKENQEDEEEEESSEEEQPGLIGGLISTFLSGLSKPDGGVDLEALVGLIGGLSVQRDDGTFDFSGLTELLQGFLGGEEGGGSDVGSFLGGLLGAVLQGLAKPPGAKGAGIFTGNVLNGILPGLSAPAPPKEDDGSKPQEGGLDSGGFLGGLLSTIIGGSTGGSSGGTGTPSGTVNPFIQIKQSIFKTIFRIFSSIVGASSSSGHKS